MADNPLSDEHRDFYKRFCSFWANPSGARVAELIAPHARIHFTGNPEISGTEYIAYMDGMLQAFPGMTVTPLDCAGSGDRFYIAWEATGLISGQQRTFLGVDRFRIADGMAIEENVVFDSAVLQPEGRPGIDS